VSAVCRRLELSRQAYYQGRHRRECQEVDEATVLKLVAEERRCQPRLGTRKLQVRIGPGLAKAGVTIGRDRLFGILRRHHLLVERQRAEYPTTTNSYHCLPVFRNLVRDREVSRPNEVWVSDLTYLRTENEGYLYLALITDKKSRKIVGFHCGDTLEASGCLKAMDMALGHLPEGMRPIHHSDRGCQYCSHEYVNKLVDRGLSVSMTETNHCAENALAERMNGILKSEYGLGYRLRSKAVARALVREAVHLYNTRRPHTALGMKTPEEVHAAAE
jgi:putative transposase